MTYLELHDYGFERGVCGIFSSLKSTVYRIEIGARETIHSFNQRCSNVSSQSAHFCTCLDWEAGVRLLLGKEADCVAVVGETRN